MKSILAKYKQYVIENQAGVITEASDSFCNLTEYSPEELIGNKTVTVFRNILRMNPDCLSENQPALIFLFTKSLKARFVHLEKIKSGKSGRIIYQVYEIPDSRFEDKNLYVEQLIKENIRSVGVYSSDFILIKANQAYLNDLPDPFNKKESAIGKHIKEFSLDFEGTPIIENGRATYFVSILCDGTEKVKNREKILCETIAFKDEFLYLITHEMKMPLTVISSALQTMSVVCGRMPDKAEKYLKTIRQNTNRQLRLVNNLLDIVKIDSGKIKLNNDHFDIVALTELIVRSVQPIANQKDIQICFHSDIKVKIISIDEEKVERILLNLLSNALKFTPKNKQIHVKVFTKRVKRKNMVCISVRDEGIGIPKDKQALVFERFGQVNTKKSRPAEGTGIGLYLVKLMVDAMGGFITLKSEENTGSNFTVMLPDHRPFLKSAPKKNKESDTANGDSRLINELAIQFSDIYY